MTARAPAPDMSVLRERWGSFVWTDENRAEADWHVAKYPDGRQNLAAMRLLDLAQSQVGATNAGGARA